MGVGVVALIERRRYRKVSTRMFGDEKFGKLSRPQPNGQSLWQYLITGPHTTSVPGLFAAGEAQLAERLRWPVAGFRKAWDEIDRAGMGLADWQAPLVWLPNALRHNAPESPNVVIGWKENLDELPACHLRDQALTDMHAFLLTIGKQTGAANAYAKAFREVLPHGFREAFAKAFAEGFAKGSADPSPNQEQEQEQESTPLPPARGGRITRSERKRAEELRRRAFGCTHEPRCESYEACLVTIVLGLREQAATA